MNDSIETYKIVASLVGGGAVGAIITAIVNSFRNRIQPVGRRLEVSILFTPSFFAGSALNPSVIVSDGTTDYKFPNLFVADVQLVNRGNRDLAAFTFGITLATLDRAVHVEPYGLDRHHAAILKTPITLACPSDMLDLELKPFNRRDSYTLKIYIVAGGSEPGPIKLGSSEAIRFTEIPSIVETIASIASSSVVKLGPFEVLFRK